MVPKKTSVDNQRFKDIFQNMQNKYQEYLKQYLEINIADSYFQTLYQKLYKGVQLSKSEEAQIDELMHRVDLNVIFVEKLLNGGAPTAKVTENFSLRADDTMDRIKYCEEKAGSLFGWDRTFILGDPGATIPSWALSAQYEKKGYLPAKQSTQLDRIYFKLGGK